MCIEEIKKLIAKSITNSLSLEESEALLNWVKAREENKKIYASIRDLHTINNLLAQKEYNTDESYKKIISRITKRRKLVSTYIASITAIVALVFVMPYVIDFSNNKKQPAVAINTSKVILMTGGARYSVGNNISVSDIKEVTRKTTETKAEAEVLINRIIVPKGQTCDLELPDGSKVTLNAMSEISFPASFSDTLREVQLVGEAMFDVKRMDKVPFIVKTRRGVTQVLGTSFNISAYPTDEHESISLISGSVKAISDADEQILIPGEQAIIYEKGQRIEVCKFSKEVIMAWREGMFIFDDQPLSGIIKEIERWYDVKFEFTYENLKNITAYVKMKKSKSLNELQDAIASTNKVSFKLEGGIIYILPKI